MTPMTAHDYAIRRAAKAADRAETDLTNARRDAAEAGGFTVGATDRVTFWSAEAERTRQALADLLDQQTP